MTGPAELDALQRALAAEHAVVWTLGSLGAATSMSRTPALFEQVTEAWEAHRERRDRLQQLIAQAGGTPVGSQAAYAVPSPLARPLDVQRAAADLEQVSTRTWAYLVASSTGGTRRWAAGVLQEVAVAAVRFGAEPEAMPGAPDLLPG